MIMSRFLGQHFLKNKGVIKKITTALDLQENDAIVEIGPGHGELTEELLKYPINLIAVEKDPDFVRELNNKFSIFSSQLSIKEGDILRVLPKLKIVNYKLKIVGNIPYYITGHLFRVIGELKNKPSIAVFTVQKEVGERLAAQPPKMNRLAASVQVWAEVKILAEIPAKDFDPPPEVDSVVVKLVTKKDIVGDNYFKAVRLLFQQPRKTILNNLSSGLKISKEESLKKLSLMGLSGAERPQNLTIEQIKKLSDLL